jgi:hypothetical protein
MTLSPATIRIMADLTDAGLLFAPHTRPAGSRPIRDCGCSSWPAAFR